MTPAPPSLQGAGVAAQADSWARQSRRLRPTDPHAPQRAGLAPGGADIQAYETERSADWFGARNLARATLACGARWGDVGNRRRAAPGSDSSSTLLHRP